MRLYQVVGHGFPDWWPQSFQTARMSEGFAELGLDTTLVYPWSSGVISWEDIGKSYGLRHVPRRKLLRDGLIHWGQCSRGFRRATFQTSLTLLAFKLGRADILFGRHPDRDPLETLLRLRRRRLLRARIFVELHEARHYTPAWDSYISGYVVTNSLLREFLRSAGVPGDTILVAEHASDLRTYEEAHDLDRRVLRKEFGLPECGPVVCYTGQLRARKNVETVIAAMEHLSSDSVLIVAGGAQESDLQRVREFVDARQLTRRVRLLGQQPSWKVVRLQMAADVLVIPHDPHLATVMIGTPLKLREYLATGKAIVAFPSAPLLEAMRADEVVWVKDDTPAGFACGIEQALARPARRVDEIRERLGGWTWTDRAECIARFMGFRHPPFP